MTDQTLEAIAARPRAEVASTFRQIAVLATLSATGTLATNILLPSLPQMAASLNVSSAAVTSAITVFLAVFALGQLVVGPISDRYGRRWPVLTGFAVFIAGSVWCSLATDLPGLLTGRVIQAAGACATSVLSRAIARDLFSGAALGRAMALIMIAMAPHPASRRCSAARSTTLSAGAPNSSLSGPLPQSERSPMARCWARPITRRAFRLIRSRSRRIISA
jgi:DHA1 family bicyclomycin/chloramphenicol resistance-like MFS transporter